MKHKHADVIKAWADGAIIQYKVGDDRWVDSHNNDPSWVLESEYRIKPEPKPDLVRYIGTAFDATGMHTDNLKALYFWPNKIKLTYDGKTGKLKSAEVIS